MSELSETILRGANLRARAYESGIAVEHAKQARRRQVFADLGASLDKVAGDWKEHRSWADAKAAEDEERTVAEADALGRATGDLSKARATLGAVTNLKTARGALLHAKSMRQLDEDEFKHLREKNDVAQATLIAQGRDEDRIEREKWHRETIESRKEIADAKGDLTREIEAGKRAAALEKQKNDQSFKWQQFTVREQRAENEFNRKLEQEGEIAGRSASIRERLAEVAQQRVDLGRDGYALNAWIAEERAANRTGAETRLLGLGYAGAIQKAYEEAQRSYEKDRAILDEDDPALAESKASLARVRTQLEKAVKALETMKPTEPKPLPKPGAGVPETQSMTDMSDEELIRIATGK